MRGWVMSVRMGWTAIGALAWTAGGCAYGVMDESGGGEGDQIVELADLALPGSGDDGKQKVPIDSSGPGAGSCYVGQGDCDPLGTDCGVGEACDVTADQGFACFPPPNEVIPNLPCDPSVGPYCMNGTTCIENVCRPYCCESSDCDSGTCSPVDVGATVDVRVCLP